MSATAKRPAIAIMGDAEQALRRLGNWRAIDEKADVTVHPYPLQGQALVEALLPADALVLVRDRTPIQAELLSQLPNLRYVVFTGSRNTTLDLASLSSRQIAVSHTEWGPS